MKGRGGETQYLLGHDELEWQRLEAQHLVWRDTLLDALPTLGVGAGSRVLEIGCGNGALLADLATLVGPTGRVVGVEIDADAVERARASAADLPWVEVHQGDVTDHDLDALVGGARFDLVVARWVLSFIDDGGRVVERLIPSVAPGGHLLVQDYAYDGIRVSPGAPILDKLFSIMPEAYRQRGGDAWIATRLPRLFVDAGLELTAVQPFCQAGDPSSAIFQWAERFFCLHDQQLVDAGLLTADERIEAHAAWRHAREVPGTVFFSPLVVNIIGRKLGEQ